MPSGFEVVSKKNISSRSLSTQFKSPYTEKISSVPWVRNKCWLPITGVTESSDKFVGLFGIFEDSNFCALHATTVSGIGTYVVNWGDGIEETFATNVVAYHTYDYNSAALAGSNYPVTFTTSTNIVTTSSAIFSNGDVVHFSDISSSIGIFSNSEYYVINASGTSFQLSNTSNGPAIVFSASSTGTILQYKQALVTVTPSSGHQIKTFDLQRRHTTLAAQIYEAPWLDITLSLPYATSIVIGAPNTTVYTHYLESATILNMNSVTTLQDMFYDCLALSYVPFFNVPSSCTSLYRTFAYCKTLQTVPEINALNVLNVSQLFDGCQTLKEPLSVINTSKVTDASYMFRGCFQLKRVPLFDTSAAINMSYMFMNCYSLEEIPKYDTRNATNMGFMFSSCRRIKYLPLLNTVKATSAPNMFVSCVELKEVPQFNFSALLDASNMFVACHSLVELPMFDFSKVTNIYSMFSSCYSLERIPKYNFSSAIGNIGFLFYLCRRLKEIPDFSFGVGKVTSMESMFRECDSLVSVPMMDTSNVTNMNYVFGGASAIQFIPAYNTSKVTNMSLALIACTSLREAPNWDLSAATDTNTMFASCFSLEKIPEYNLTKVLNANSMFNSCYLLYEIPWVLNLPVCTTARDLFSACVNLNYIPKINIPLVTDAYRMFYNTVLIEIPEIDFSSVTSLSETFNITPALKLFKATGIKVSVNLSSHIFSATELNRIFTNLATVTGQTITVTGCAGAATDNPTIATAKGWTVVG